MSLTSMIAPVESDDTIQSIKDYISRPPKTSVVLDITPRMAKAILDTYNTDNRGLKRHKIRPLVGELRSGGWLVTGETIKFSDRRLLDGQNRLTACFESGVPIRTHVVFGIPDEAFAIIDTGAPRTGPDVLVCAKVLNPGIIAHAVARLNSWENNPGKREVLGLSPNQILELYRTKYRGLDSHIGTGQQLQKATRTPAARGVVLSYAFAQVVSPIKADAFMQAWISGDPSVQQAALLRRRLAQFQQMLVGGIRANTTYAMAIKAFQAYAEDRPAEVTQIRLLEDEPFPVLKKPGRQRA